MLLVAFMRHLSLCHYSPDVSPSSSSSTSAGLPWSGDCSFEPSSSSSGDAAPGAVSGVATHLLYSAWIIIKGHDCLSYLNMKDLTELFCIKNEIGLGAKDLS
jgi:hypothetical protein